MTGPIDHDIARRGARARRQAGFTLMETLVALAVFAIAVVGLVAIESRSMESQKAARDLREAERIAQDVMSDLVAEGYLQLVYRDFVGGVATFPYDDRGADPQTRIRDQHRPPADIPASDNVAGSVRGQYIVFRAVDWVVDPGNVPSNPITVGLDEGRVLSLVIDVVVLWIDTTNPSSPPPDGLRVTDLVPEMILPGNPEFRAYVGGVRLRHVRANDAVLPES